MQTNIIFYIIISGLIALSLALFQYAYKTKKSKLRYLYVALRFISYFSVLLVLINPKFESLTYYNEKPNLVIAIDNTESVAYLKQDQKVKDLTKTLLTNKQLNDKFNIQPFTFGKSFQSMDSLTFNESQSNFSEAFKTYSELFNKNQVSPLLLISDGNQTLGSDFQYAAKSIKQPVFPIVLGDTTTYSDLRLQQVNVNRYAYLKNKFPIEIFANYSGNSEVKSTLRIKSGTSVLFSKSISFSPNTTQVISTTLNANRVGVNGYVVELSPLTNEKNTVNNIKNIAVEVIDQKTNIAIVSEQIHPDLGAFKKAIEANEQRKATILKPKDYLKQINDFQLVILYNPNSNFNSVFAEIRELKLNTFIVAGKTTDWSFLNGAQDLFLQEVTNQTEDYQATFNSNFGNFIIDNMTFSDYPPLTSEFGDISFLTAYETILFKSINGTTLENPLLTTMESNRQKHALLNGEGFWKWRAHCFLETESFVDFDNFFGKLIQFLSSNKRRNRINIDFKSFYNGNENITINAQYFNKNYEFDKNANLEIILKHKTNNTLVSYPLLLNKLSYSVELDGIKAGDYQFTIENKDEPISASGQFKVLEYNVEQQFLNANVSKLESLASETGGQLFFVDNSETIIDVLLNDNRFNSIQKSKREIIPLIDYKYLLVLIALALSLEWFIRKYNGLI